MLLPTVFCVLFLQFVFGSPVDEVKDDIYEIPRYHRDLEFFDSDHWYKWWYGEKRKSPTLQERIVVLETRQKVLYDLLICESHSRLRTFDIDQCELFRTKAEQVFGVPAKGTATTPSPVSSKSKPQTATTGTKPQGTTTSRSTVTTVVSTTNPSTTIPVVTTSATTVPTNAPSTVAATTSV